jgi:hypothetical protein
MRMLRSLCVGIAVAAVYAASFSSGAAGAAVGTSAVVIEGLTATVSNTGQLFVAGRVADIGLRSAEWAAVTAAVTFVHASGRETEQQVRIQQPIPPGASLPFAAETTVLDDVVVQYTVVVSGRSGNAILPEARAAGTMPPSAYAEFARGQISVDVQLGAPSTTARGSFVQAFFSISGTRAIPPSWVQDVRVLVPVQYQATGAGLVSTTALEVHLAPGRAATVLVPAYASSGVLMGPPQISGVWLSQ